MDLLGLLSQTVVNEPATAIAIFTKAVIITLGGPVTAVQPDNPSSCGRTEHTSPLDKAAQLTRAKLLEFDNACTLCTPGPGEEEEVHTAHYPQRSRTHYRCTKTNTVYTNTPKLHQLASHYAGADSYHPTHNGSSPPAIASFLGNVREQHVIKISLPTGGALPKQAAGAQWPRFHRNQTMLRGIQTLGRGPTGCLQTDIIYNRDCSRRKLGPTCIVFLRVNHKRSWLQSRPCAPPIYCSPPSHNRQVRQACISKCNHCTGGGHATTRATLSSSSQCPCWWLAQQASAQMDSSSWFRSQGPTEVGTWGWTAHDSLPLVGGATRAGSSGAKGDLRGNTSGGGGSPSPGSRGKPVVHRVASAAWGSGRASSTTCTAAEVWPQGSGRPGGAAAGKSEGAAAAEARGKRKAAVGLVSSWGCLEVTWMGAGPRTRARAQREMGPYLETSGGSKGTRGSSSEGQGLVGC